MTGQRLSPRALGAPGCDDGTYGLVVEGGLVTGLGAVGVPAGGAAGETLSKISGTDYDVDWVELSRPTILLPAGSTAADVPAGTPVGAIVLVKSS